MHHKLKKKIETNLENDKVKFPADKFLPISQAIHKKSFENNKMEKLYFKEKA